MEALARYYESKYFSEYAQDQLYGFRKIIFSQILDRIENETGIGNLLDVGCGCGFFMKEAMKRGWDVAGIDPSEESITYCDSLLGSAVAHKGTLKDFSQEKVYDVITMINVLDHSTEPWSEIERAGILIRPGGLIFLRFPNGLFHPTLLNISEIFNLENFMKKFLVFHEYSFTPRFIRRLLSDCGFSNIIIQNAGFSGGNSFNRLLKKIFGVAVNSMYVISSGSFTIGPSLEVTAQKI